MCVRPHIVSQGAVKCVCETSYGVPGVVLGPSEWTSAWCLSTSAQFPAMTSASCLSTSAQFYFRFPPVCLLPSNFPPSHHTQVSFSSSFNKKPKMVKRPKMDKKVLKKCGKEVATLQNHGTTKQHMKVKHNRPKRFEKGSPKTFH